MVIKMKLKLWLCLALAALTAQNAAAEATPLAANPGLQHINTRGKVLCGTAAGNKILTYRDNEGKWQGMDVELCKMLSTAIFGRNDRIEMVPLEANQVSNALYTNKIDVMIGGLPFSATTEISTRATPVDVWYYDRQVFLARKIEGATSMEAYRGKKVCVVNNSDDLAKLEVYNSRYQLGFSLLRFPNFRSAKEAFLLHRCQLLTGNSMILRDVVVNSPAGVSDVEMLPETITVRPVYVFADKANGSLQSIVKWTMNALKEAEENELTSKNVDIHLSSKDPSIRNLLGLDQQLWQRFKLSPTWLQTYLRESGNYGEVFEKYLGEESVFKIKRNENNLLKNKGLMFSVPFV